MSIDFKKELNENQFKAATSNAKHLRIVAGAGTGKTRTLTYRLAYLLLRGDMYPTEIVAITFTNKVAKEMKERVTSILERANFEVRIPFISTFHGFCYRFLLNEIHLIEGYKKNFQVADEEVQKEIFKRIADSLGVKYSDDRFAAARQIISSLKSEGKEIFDFSPNDVRYNVDYDFTYSVFEKYQAELAKNNLVDFDDLLIYTRKILKGYRDVREYYQNLFKCFLIDEFQDTNDIQYDIVRLLMNEETELCVVGDPDQTIYTWRGANNYLIKRALEEDFRDLETVTLDLNYRSTQKILDRANELIKHNNDRVDKSLVAFNKEEGQDVYLLRSYSQESEAQEIVRRISELHRFKNVNYSDIAIIYRSNFISRNFEHMFSRMGIPYRLYGSIKFYERAEIKAALAYLRLMINKDDDYSFLRVIQNPSRKIGDVAISNLETLAKERNVSIFELVLDDFDNLPLKRYQKEGLRQFVDSYKRHYRLINAEGIEGKELSRRVRAYFEDAGFLNYINELDLKEKESLDKSTLRMDNVNEFLQAINDFVESSEEERLSLTDFLINVSLESAQDEIEEADAVLVMTAHVSKGLEFDYVFIASMCDNIFPSSYAYITGEKAIEEERRLFYVAMTRARKYLCVSTSGGTRYDGSLLTPSPFLKEAGLVSENRKPVPFDSRSPFKPRETIRKPISSFQGVKRLNVVKNDDSYVVGDKVSHSSFGIGKVIEVIGDKIKVEFKDNDIRTLKIGYKGFSKIKE